MSDGIYIATSGAVARQLHLDAVGHNLANVETPGYRARSINFESYLVDQPSGRVEVEAKSTNLNLKEGTLDATENPYDLALMGDGYFTVETPEGVALTRGGNFRTNGFGELTTQEGYPVLNDTGGPILAPPDADFYVDEQGNLWDDVGMIDRLNIVRPNADATLTPAGPSTFLVQGGVQNLEPGDAVVRQGYLERANVNAVESMTDLVTLQRHFEAMTKLIQTFSTIDNRAAKSIGSVAG